MNTKQKCIWTGSLDSRVIPVKLNTLSRLTIPIEKTFFVLPEFEQELRKYNDKFVNRGRLFLMLIMGLTLFIPIVVFKAMIFSFPNSILLLSVGIITALIGVVIILFPFPTPETAKWLGLKRSFVLARSAGFITFALGMAISILPTL